MFPPWAKIQDFHLTEHIAVSHGFDFNFVAAVVQTESGGNPNACRYERFFKYFPHNLDEIARNIYCTNESLRVLCKTSWGLMQVMGTVAYEHGLYNESNVHRRWPTSLTTPAIGLRYGCLHLKVKYDLYGPDPARVYAAYNAGSPRYMANGDFINQVSVDRFLKYYEQLRQPC